MMWRRFFWLFTILLVFIVQLIMANYISPFGVTPNVLILATIFFAIRGGPLTGELLGFTWGLLADLTSVSIFGSQAFMLTFVGYIVGKLERQVDEEKYFAQMVLVLIMSMVNILGLALLEVLFAGSTQRFRNSSVIIDPIYSTILCPLVFLGLLKWSRIFRRSDLKAKLL